ncbi:DUF1611 domain-containing protein [Xinfangfangia sp. CPCC 101601]|uniref:DUF1611 domain-containing protein n=1 Tax=Pseudogemmobacter lacusdianii TaxID=3069608 RepID=A0ABU0W1I7_9RHOB|nr:DUF1611 domain-containing protein [Xinfangfangia sp. CPCC 101601]MDQ2067884.1 DUF1611 domain-containing protein [Xinfangfangia sp. CPCC 101601]
MTLPSIAAPYLIYLGDTPVAELAKTGAGLAFWRPERCLAQLREPGCAADLGLPDMDLAQAAAAGAKTLVIGTAAPGGQLPPHWAKRIVEAMEAGLDIASGLHVPLRSNPDLAATADRTGRQLHDVRLSGGPFPIGNGLPRSGRRLLMVGTDCAVGKKYSALAIHRELQDRKVPATFRATGQTGVLIDGHGIAVDAIVADFLAGAVEQLTPAAAADHWDVVEGQGALIHPAYAGVSLGLLHGAQPEAFVVCHEAGRTELSGFPGHKTASIGEIIELTTILSRRVAPNIRCAGICINTARLPEAEALAVLAEAEAEHGLPATDPVRFGVAKLVDHLLA